MEKKLMTITYNKGRIQRRSRERKAHRNHVQAQLKQHLDALREHGIVVKHYHPTCQRRQRRAHLRQIPVTQ